MTPVNYFKKCQRIQWQEAKIRLGSYRLKAGQKNITGHSQRRWINVIEKIEKKCNIGRIFIFYLL